MTLQDAKDWVKEHKWAMALVLLIVGGYTVGKDLALRDNAAVAEAGEGI